MHRHPLSTLLLLVLLATGCATATAPAPAPAPAPEAAATDAAPFSDAVRWTATAAEHRAAYLQTYRQAAVVLEELVEGRRPYTWVVSLDADETVISNARYEIERAGREFDSASWSEWVHRQEAAALPGARDFLEHVRRLGGHIAIVTNRSESLCPPTVANLRQERLPYDTVLCKPDDGPSDKTPRWKALEEGTASQQLPPLELVMWIGDNIHDFPGGSQDWATGSEDDVRWFGERFFVLPNPMYGSWTDNPMPKGR